MFLHYLANGFKSHSIPSFERFSNRLENSVLKFLKHSDVRIFVDDKY